MTSRAFFSAPRLPWLPLLRQAADAIVYEPEPVEYVPRLRCLRRCFLHPGHRACLSIRGYVCMQVAAVWKNVNDAPSCHYGAVNDGCKC
ncbi:MAG: hypothetical protein R3D65_02450 [Zhengella sp.]|uniref:hypothetical protein n=1 Tax=Zhengella sp. TaxID=2282762 RepID=UPI0035273444